jgi:hypothetical protein
MFALTQRKGRFLVGVLGAYDQAPLLHNLPIVKLWTDRTIAWISRLRRQPFCLLTKTDEVRVSFWGLNDSYDVLLHRSTILCGW